MIGRSSVMQKDVSSEIINFDNSPPTEARFSVLIRTKSIIANAVSSLALQVGSLHEKLKHAGRTEKWSLPNKINQIGFLIEAEYYRIKFF